MAFELLRLELIIFLTVTGIVAGMGFDLGGVNHLLKKSISFLILQKEAIGQFADKKFVCYSS